MDNIVIREFNQTVSMLNKRMVQQKPLKDETTAAFPGMVRLHPHIIYDYDGKTMVLLVYY